MANQHLSKGTSSIDFFLIGLKTSSVIQLALPACHRFLGRLPPSESHLLVRTLFFRVLWAPGSCRSRHLAVNRSVRLDAPVNLTSESYVLALAAYSNNQ